MGANHIVGDQQGPDAGQLASVRKGSPTAGNPLQVAGAFDYNHITTATTTQVKSGKGILRAIVVNTTAAGTITIVDNTSTSTPVIAVLKASIAEGTYYFDVAFQTGLRIITAAASDITAVYV